MESAFVLASGNLFKLNALAPNITTFASRNNAISAPHSKRSYIKMNVNANAPAAEENAEAARRVMAAKDRPTFAEQCKTMMVQATYGTISTLHKVGEANYPFASMVELASDEQGRPVFGISTLSMHTRDLQASSKMSICVSQPGFASIQDSRFTLVGDCVKDDSPEVQKQLKEIYRQKFPNSFWLDFGDFAMYRMTNIVSIRYVGGFGRAGNVKPEEYLAAQPDPLLAFVGRVIDHMNKDHEEDLINIVNHYAPPTGTDENGLKKEIIGAKMISMDKVGMDLSVVAKLVPADPNNKPVGYEEGKEPRQNWRERLKFPFEATDRKLAKEVLVDMTKAAQEAKAKVPH
eukprot:CAMPEP_0184692920 /NCGR_PEP_ID=MMETSP0313-20130426/1233_1 /TAXON_ID=2792 /ORGANISM="Porphyridium aerugineum, Strain SAG 1380-2" /LENGTH=345 /DNA_ID=CAMNT_0027150827 /DNA_START=50 /DNA_END=1087 /DNA_ORIENTATION=+